MWIGVLVSHLLHLPPLWSAPFLTKLKLPTRITLLIKPAELRGKYFAVLHISLLLSPHFPVWNTAPRLTASYRCLFPSSRLVSQRDIHETLSTVLTRFGPLQKLPYINNNKDVDKNRLNCQGKKGEKRETISPHHPESTSLPPAPILPSQYLTQVLQPIKR
jgi:hypothetical protein